jgi:hypothetical protein
MIKQNYIQIFNSKVIQQSGCWAFNSAKDRDGYHKQSYMLVGENIRRQTGAHRFMLMSLGHTIPPGYVVCHHCDNPSCVNPEHLFIGTVTDNNLDKKSKGRERAPKGEQQAHASISDNVARLIKSEAVVGWRSGYNNGSNLKEVAAKYGVKVELVRRIARGELYKHI